ncbi:hypothetical protein [Streptomyces shenzhenensis]|uniref:Uncharacterized protein n=1 Tax=Streptomyces shenzhenensis TaxID=943815 RepID=A0A3M0HTT0_9ACTN|nr:hypothetical protein [Streptomyces shenzhenensis]RMB79954.1 hypothetical protein CTZ28_42985 [Streptomyces shenzhenensis]
MTDRISTLISAFGVLVCTVVLAMSIGSGMSAPWIAFWSATFLVALYALVRDVRHLRAGQTN